MPAFDVFSIWYTQANKKAVMGNVERIYKNPS